MSSDSGKKQLVPGMACATTDQHTSNNVPLAALWEKSCVVQKYLPLKKKTAGTSRNQNPNIYTPKERAHSKLSFGV